MKILNIVSLFVLGATLVVGCGKKEEGTDPAGAGGSAATATTTAAVTTPPTNVAPPKPTNNPADGASVKACCAALRKTAAEQKAPSDKTKYDTAAGLCDGLAGQVSAGTVPKSSAMTNIRANLGGKPLPGGC